MTIGKPKSWSSFSESEKPKYKIIENKTPTLQEMQEYVGGWIEVVYLPNDEQLIVNEEGLILELPYNSVASCHASRTIVGNAILLRKNALMS